MSKDTWPEWLCEDGNGHIWTVKAKNERMALGLVTPEGHTRVRDVDGERDELENHTCRHCGWSMYFLVDDRGQVVDWVATTRKDG